MTTVRRLIGLLGVLLPLCGCWTAAVSGKSTPAPEPKDVAIAIADDVRSECGRFMDAFQARRWAERKNPITEGDIPDVEARLLDTLVAVMERFPTVEAISVVYGDRLLTGERRYASAADRRVGRRSRVGDMYAGPLRTLRYGHQISEEQRAALIGVKRGGQRIYLDVPIVEDSRYICGLLVTIRS